jgi:hypothetical protein
MKRARARAHVRELQSAVETHSVSHHAGIDIVIAEDRLSARFVARLSQRPPAEEWSLLVGDAVHNYRVALDALAWELATLDGRNPSPQHAKQVYFPICLTLVEWQRKAKGPLSSVPPQILDRLLQVQPFHKQPAENGIFVWLHNMDATDKHKASITTVARAAPHRSSFQARVLLDDYVSLDDTNFTLDPTSDSGPIRDGQDLFFLRTEHPIREVSTDSPIPLSLQVDMAGHNEDVFHMFDQVEKQLDATLRWVLDGEFDPNEIRVSTEEL